MGNVLIDEYPLLVPPTLVKLLGLERAIVLQQIHFHLRAPKSGRDIDGHHWIWNTYEEWREDFPFWAERTIRKWICSLEKEGYLVSAQFDKQDWNARKYYRIDYDFLEEKVLQLQQNPMRSVRAASPGSVRAASPGSVRAASPGSVRAAPLGTETSTETPTETPTETLQDLNYSKTHSLRRNSAHAGISPAGFAGESAGKPGEAESSPGVSIWNTNPPSCASEGTESRPGQQLCADNHSHAPAFSAEMPASEVLLFEVARTASSDVPREPAPVPRENPAISDSSVENFLGSAEGFSGQKGELDQCQLLDISLKQAQSTICVSNVAQDSNLHKSKSGKTTKVSSKSKVDSDPRATHPAIVACRDLTRRFPNKILWDKLIQTLGDMPDLEKLRACYAEAVERGPGQSNGWKWATEWYVSGIPEWGFKGKQQKPKEKVNYEPIDWNKAASENARQHREAGNARNASS